MAQEQFRLGILSQAEASTGDNRHILTRSLGNAQYVAADTITVNVNPGDLILLCSDGLHSQIPDEAILRLMNSFSDINVIASALVSAANDAGGHDNEACKSFALDRWNKWVSIEVGRIGCYKWLQPQKSILATCWITTRSRKSWQRAAWPRYSAPSTRSPVRPVAIKVPHPQIDNDAALTDRSS